MPVCTTSCQLLPVLIVTTQHHMSPIVRKPILYVDNKEIDQPAQCWRSRISVVDHFIDIINTELDSSYFSKLCLVFVAGQTILNIYFCSLFINICMILFTYCQNFMFTSFASWLFQQLPYK